MKTMAVSEFKATCLAVVERVRQSGESVMITKRGQPVAELVPVTSMVSGERPLGQLAGTAEIRGDLINATGSSADWEALDG